MTGSSSVPSTTTDLHGLLELMPYLTPGDRLLIERAYRKAEAGHAGQQRKSGEPYFTHCVAVARILAEMRMDAEAVAAGLMHDLLEDTTITPDEIRREFGKAVLGIVQSVTKLKNLPVKADIDPTTKRTKAQDKELEYIRKMALAMGDDIRVVLVKLADRLHNMRTLGYMDAEKQRRIARETLDIFAPLANRLGIWQFKWELEDLSYRYLEPEGYRIIARSIDERRSDREAYMSRVIAKLRAALQPYETLRNAAISGRPKHIYSIAKKMERKHLPFEQIYDVRAVRLIVETIPECYLALGVVHSLWRPIPNEFDDYIATPKDNFYRSLHTAVRDDEGKTIEVQIRTWEMHDHAEYGIAAHWRYKEGGKQHDERFEEHLKYLRKLMEFGSETDDAAKFVDAMKAEVFNDRVYAFTPKGDVVDLPAGSTPIDFAYHIHTDIGHRCRGAKVGGRLVNLDYQLQTGDQVEIIVMKRGGPSLDWLNPNLGFVKTERARAKIRYYFRKLNRENHIHAGRHVLESEMKKLGVLEVTPFEQVAKWFNFEKLDDFLAQIGAGDINGGQIASKILEVERREREEREKHTLRQTAAPSDTLLDSANDISVMGGSGILMNLGRCCNPVPGDPIIGFVSKGRGIIVHRRDCPNIGSEPERLTEVVWGRGRQERRYSVPIEIIAYDRDGLMKDISTVIADEKVSMSHVNVGLRNNIAAINITAEIVTMEQLNRILARVGSLNSVVEARRRLIV